jgi:hypothetical protein
MGPQKSCVSMRSLKDREATGDVMIGERRLLLGRTNEEVKNMGKTMYGVPASRQ